MVAAADAGGGTSRARRPGGAERAVWCIVHIVAACGLLLPVALLGLTVNHLRPVPAICAVLGAVALGAFHPWLIPGWRGRRWRANLGLRSLDADAIPWLAGAIVVFQCYQWVAPGLLAQFTDARPHPHPPYAFADEPLGWLIVPLSALLVVPLWEELAFRGYLQHKLGRVVGRGMALAMTGCLFALAHGSVAGMPFFAYAGVVFGSALLAFRSIWAPVLLHMAANGLGQIPATASLPPAIRPMLHGIWPATLTLFFASGVLLLLYGAYRARLGAGRRKRAELATRTRATLPVTQPV